MALCNNRDPKDEMQAHVSLHHWVAVAFIRGTARIQDMDTETAVKDPALMAFQSKVEATLNPALAADQTEVTITMTDGTKHTCRIEHGIGSRLNPMSDADLERKFIGLAEPVIGAARAAGNGGENVGGGGVGGCGRTGKGGGMTEEFDYIVTGAGSAGCVVAARLSENGRYRVLLLEAGGKDSNAWIHIPLGFARTYVNPRVNWKFETQPQPQLNNRLLYLPRGKTLGGSSSINGMVYIRGNHGDYDEWRQRGCEGWDWDSVLPYFRKAENQARGEDEFHGVGGPLHVSDQRVKIRTGRGGVGGVSAGGNSEESRLQRRPAGRLRLLSDHNEQAAAMEHGQSLSANRRAGGPI